MSPEKSDRFMILKFLLKADNFSYHNTFTVEIMARDHGFKCV